jgi:hypothetical protein
MERTTLHLLIMAEAYQHERLGGGEKSLAGCLAEAVLGLVHSPLLLSPTCSGSTLSNKNCQWCYIMSGILDIFRALDARQFDTSMFAHRSMHPYIHDTDRKGDRVPVAMDCMLETHARME